MKASLRAIARLSVSGAKPLAPVCLNTVCSTLDLLATLVAARHEASQRNRHRHTFFARGLGTRRRVPLALRPRRPTRRAHEAHKHKTLKPAISKGTGDWPLANAMAMTGEKSLGRRNGLRPLRGGGCGRTWPSARLGEKPPATEKVIHTKVANGSRLPQATTAAVRRRASACWCSGFVPRRTGLGHSAHQPAFRFCTRHAAALLECT